MIVSDLLNKAYMQLNDTGKLTYTPYVLLEYYNEGHQLLHSLLAKYLPELIEQEIEEIVDASYELPEECLYVVSVGVNGEDVPYKRKGNRILFDDVVEQPIVVTFIPTAGYKALYDETEYTSEFEAMMVTYVVSRAMNLDMSFVADWERRIADLASQSSNNVVFAKGYWSHDGRRTDYDD